MPAAPTDDALDNRERWLVPLSLGASFLANDGEELLTMAPTTGISQTHVRVGIATMGVLLGAAVADGIHTRGRGWLYQDVQLVFGAHGFGHLAATALGGRYTTGVATSPTVVLPQWWWAASRLRRAGVPRTAHWGRAIALTGGWLTVAHALGALAATRSRQKEEA
ncbi:MULTISPECIES: HXXEE domain-containing protein [unclassified Luteococcus]|uniref:HXXEE domain-containing protein n=1 Tax=unclassified Luteococcus TaxID=2639923 RepID=UPI00313E9A0B